MESEENMEVMEEFYKTRFRNFLENSPNGYHDYMRGAKRIVYDEIDHEEEDFKFVWREIKVYAREVWHEYKLRSLSK